MRLLHKKWSQQQEQQEGKRLDDQRCASFTPHTFKLSLRSSLCILTIQFIHGSCFSLKKHPKMAALFWIGWWGTEIFYEIELVCTHTPSVMRGGQCMLFPGSCQWHTDLSAWTPHLQSSVTNTTALCRKRAECQCLSSLTGTFPVLSLSFVSKPCFSFQPISICMDMEMSSNTRLCCPLTSPMWPVTRYPAVKSD